MKNLKLLAIAILIGGTSLYAYETNEPDPVTPAPLLRAQIVDLLPQTFFVNLEEDTTVKIDFTYGSRGEIIVLKVGSNNKHIKKYIRKHLNQKEVNNPGEEGRVYSFVLKIKEG